jgi:selenocysteine lyase/cysteine desulfurase
VRPSKDKSPHRWETGTSSYETIAGVGAAIDYLEAIGDEYGAAHRAHYSHFSGRRQTLKAAMSALIEYERELVAHLIDVIRRTPGTHIAGITDPARYDERVPTVVFVKEGHTPEAIAAHLAQHNIFVWNGNYYAVEIMDRLGRGEHGMVRVGLAHYNTHAEIDQFERALAAL